MNRRLTSLCSAGLMLLYPLSIHAQWTSRAEQTVTFAVRKVHRMAVLAPNTTDARAPVSNSHSNNPRFFALVEGARKVTVGLAAPKPDNAMMRVRFRGLGGDRIVSLQSNTAIELPVRLASRDSAASISCDLLYRPNASGAGSGHEPAVFTVTE